MLFRSPELREIFDAIDTDHSGSISLNEFFTAISQIAKVDDIESLILFFKLADADGNGTLEFDEFEKMAHVLSGMQDGSNKSVFTALFKLIDADNSGSIDCKEIEKLCKAAGYAPSGKDVDEFVKALDTNGDGVIDLEEFLQLVE